MGGSGTKGSTTTINQATPQPDPTIQPLIKASADKFLEAQMGSPSLLSLLTATPQNVPGQNALEQYFSSLQYGMATPGAALDASGNVTLPTSGSSTNPLNAMSFATQPEQQALDLISKMTGGPLGSSPATQEGMAALERQYQQDTLPTLQNQLMLAGLGNSGALAEGIARARGGVASATVPLLQQEMVDRMNAVNQLAGLGGGLAQRQASTIGTALATAGTPREIETQQEQAKFLDQQRQQALIEQLTMGPLNIFGPSLVGQAGTSGQDFSTRTGGIWRALVGGGAK